MKGPALLSLAFGLFSWGLAPVFIRLLRGAYDPYSQAFIRYFFAASALAVLCLVIHRDEYLALLRRPWPLLGLAGINITHQICWTVGCYRASATLSQLIVQIGVVFVILLSYVLFHEERSIIRSPLYLLGTAFSFIGMAVVLTGARHTTGAVDFLTAALLVIPAICWAVYVIWVKHLVANCHPVPLYAVLSIFITLGTAVFACLLGDPVCILKAPPKITLLTFASGILPLAGAHPAFHFAQKYLGSAFSSSCNLLTPLLTCLLSWFFLDDVPLTFTQWAGAAVLLTGTMMVVRKKAGSESPASAVS